MQVEEDDVELANPPGFDKIEDLAQLRYLNESSVLHVLRQRYGNNLIHTYSGPSIITINPSANLAIYSDQIIQMFKDCQLEDMPPHIYSVAQGAYRTLLRSRKDQSVALIGRSGSGKSTNVRHVLNSLVVTASCPNKALTLDKVNSINILLEAFGNARTIMNANATRFSQLFSLDFDTLGHIVSASIQAMMLEKARVVRRPEGEPTFNIFYQMMAGLDGQTKKDLYLDNLNEPNLFMTPLQRIEDKTKAGVAFNKIVSQAFKTLNVTSSEALSLWSTLAAIYHLGVASVTRGNMNRTQFARPHAAQKAAHCLGTTVEDLNRTIFQGNTSSSTLNRKLRSADKESANLPDGIESLEGFVIGLYQEVFNAVIYLINRSISTTANASNTIFVLDTPGFQNPATCGRMAGATFEELCHNYTMERLQLMFHDRTIASLHERYAQEQIECDMISDIEDLPTPAPLVSLIDKQAGVRVSSHDLASADRRGLLWLLDEEAIFPGATDDSFVERLMLQYNQRGSEDLLRQGPIESNKKHFVLQHFQGTNPVLYNAEGWLQASREDAAVRAAGNMLQESNTKAMADLFSTSRGPMTSLTGSVAGLEGSHGLRRASSMRRTFTSGQAGIKRHSVALQVKFQVDGMCEQLRRTKIHFVHCFLPQHNAGLCDVKGKAKSPVNGDEAHMNVPLVRSQVYLSFRPQFDGLIL
jgi:myosin-18